MPHSSGPHLILLTGLLLRRQDCPPLDGQSLDDRSKINFISLVPFSLQGYALLAKI